MSPDLALLVLTVAVGPRKPLKNKNKNQKNPQIPGAQDHTWFPWSSRLFGDSDIFLSAELRNQGNEPHTMPSALCIIYCYVTNYCHRQKIFFSLSFLGSGIWGCSLVRWLSLRVIMGWPSQLKAWLVGGMGKTQERAWVLMMKATGIDDQNDIHAKYSVC